MPDRRTHRGAHPEDATLFAPAEWPRLQAAAGELAWLLDRGYPLRSALALVGDRHDLTQRQRLALARSSATAGQCRDRARRAIPPAALAGRELWIDGYNLLITIEAALAGGVILLGRDGCCRDMASLHGSYRSVEETDPAVRLIGTWLVRQGVGPVRWILDRPVGNSGRLRGRLEELARVSDWNWAVELADSPDRVLRHTAAITATSDSVVLDHAGAWCNVARHVIAEEIPAGCVLDLSLAAS